MIQAEPMIRVIKKYGGKAMYQATKVSKLIFILLVVALMGIPVLAVAAPSYYPKDYGKIVEASRAEKELLIYSNVSMNNWKNTFDVFRKMYPWITIRTLDLSGNEILPRLIAESETNTPSADFVTTQDAVGWARLLGEKRLQRYPSPEIPYLPKWASRQETIYTSDISQVICAWNTRLLPADMVPKGVADLADKVQKRPDFFRGKITSYQDGGFGIYAMWALSKHHGEKFWKWVDIIGPATRPCHSGGEQLEKILSGEYAMSWMLGALTMGTSTAKQAGKLLAWKYMEDGNAVILRGMGIPSKAANPYSAKLFLDFMLSQEGQVAMTKGNMTAYRPDAAEKIPDPTLHLGALIKTIGEKNMAICGWDPEYADEAKYRAVQSRYRQAYFGKK
jgi:iron(III) transport system substrate-binding protein